MYADDMHHHVYKGEAIRSEHNVTPKLGRVKFKCKRKSLSKVVNV